jgi:hypothetical protein
MGEVGHSYNILDGNSEGKRPLERHRRRREDNIKINLREIMWEVVDWMYLVQERVE